MSFSDFFGFKVGHFSISCFLLSLFLVLYSVYLSCCPWSHGLRSKKNLVSVAVPPAPVRVPSQRPLAPSVASVTSVANDDADN